MTTLAEAYKILASAKFISFEVDDLLSAARARRLTTEQVARINQLAAERASFSSLGLLPIIELLRKAQAAQKRAPKITLQTSTGKLVLKLAGDRSSRPGTVTVTDGGTFEAGTFYGRISVFGEFDASRAATPEVADLLRALAANPAAVSGQHGVATGTCCYCSRALSTKESRSVGYGPDCAEKYGLPWGDTTAADAADAESKPTFEQVASELTEETRAVFAKIAEKRKQQDAEHKAAWHPRGDDPSIDEQSECHCAASARATFEQSQGRYTGSKRTGD